LAFEWVAAVTQLARTDQGVFALMHLWEDADSRNKAGIVGDLQDSLDDYAYAPHEPAEQPSI
jgi:hypothetical protein